MQRSATSPSRRATGAPQAGQRSGIENSRSAPVRFSLRTAAMAGMTSPAFSTRTWSPMRMSLRRMSSSLWSVARAIVEPQSRTARSSATGVRTPVRPTCTVIASTTVSARSGAYL